MNVGFPHPCFSFLPTIDCGNAAVWRERQIDAVRASGAIARQQRKQAVKPDPGEEPARNSDPFLVPDSDTRELPTRNLLLITREADLLGPYVGRTAYPFLQLPAHLQPRQVQRP